MSGAPTVEEIEATLERLSPHIVRTPTTPLLSSRTGEGVWLKLELFQRTGTFKIRGALNNLLQAELAPGQGVTAVSAGNHGVAVSCAASLLGVDAKIVMLSSANPARRALAESYGSTLLFRDSGAEAFATADELTRDEGRLMIHPFDGPRVAEGSAGVGHELMTDLPDLDAVVVSIGGGGLAGGVSCAVKQVAPACEVFGVEPVGSACMSESVAAGRALSGFTPDSIADSLGPPMTTDYTVDLCSRFIDDIVTVSDDDMCAALAILFQDAKLVVEPAGAAALAALLGPLRSRLAGRRVGLIVCGSCLDAASFGAFLQRGSGLLGDRDHG